ncbi:mCG140919, partial [Mus musculus]
ETTKCEGMLFGPPATDGTSLPLASGSEDISPSGELEEFCGFSWYTIFLELLPIGVFTDIGILCLSGDGG